MKIEANTVVHMHYKLTNANNEVLDNSEGQEPLAYIHGIGNIIPGLEKEMEGKKVGDKISYISTGVGAFLEFVEGKTLPAIAMLESRS